MVHPGDAKQIIAAGPVQVVWWGGEFNCCLAYGCTAHQHASIWCPAIGCCCLHPQLMALHGHSRRRAGAGGPGARTAWHSLTWSAVAKAVQAAQQCWHCSCDWSLVQRRCLSPVPCGCMGCPHCSLAWCRAGGAGSPCAVPTVCAWPHSMCPGCGWLFSTAFLDSSGEWRPAPAKGSTGAATGARGAHGIAAASSSAPGACLDGHDGHLCQRCAPGWSTAQGGTCRPCAAPALQWLSLFGGVLIGAAVMRYIVYTTLEGTAEAVATGAEIVPYVALYKLLFTHLQQIAIAASFPMRWPPLLLSMFSVFDSSASVSAELVSPDCLKWPAPPPSCCCRCLCC